jgi:hypothetical protein
MSEADIRTPNRFLWRAGIALLQGALLWWLYRAVEQERWPATDHGWLFGLIAATVLVPVAHYLIADLTTDPRRVRVLAPLALALFGFGWHHGAWTANRPNFDSVAFSLALVVLLFHALPFVQVWLANRRLRPQYEELFHYAWRNTLLVAFGGVFCGVFWLLLWLWGALFRMLGVDFFQDLFSEAYFAIPATTVAAGVGMQLAGSVERLQHALRNQLLTMLKWLAPLAVLILAMFTLTLLVKSPELLLEQRRVISAAWLLWLVALTVALLNAAYQDGRTQAPYPPWLGKAIRLVVPLLLPVSVLALYAIGVRVDSYGLTVARSWGLLVAVIALVYALGYAWAALRRGSWMGGMGVVNVAVALASVVLLTLMLTPALSPERLAAASQYARVLEDPGSDAYQYLHFNSGEYGRARLRRLAGLQDHPEAAEVRAAAARELEKRYPIYGAGSSRELSADDFEVFPAGDEMDPGLLTALRKTDNPYALRDCEPAIPCLVLFVDLNRDDLAEALVFADMEAIAARREAGGWVLVSDRHLPYWVGDRKELENALAERRYRVRDPDWQILEIEGRIYSLEGPAKTPIEESGTTVRRVQ